VQVDVATYVAAMRNDSLVSGDKFYSQVEVAVRNVLASEETVSSVTKLIADKDSLAPDNVSRLLQGFANEAVEEIRKTSFITVDSRTLDKNRGSLLQIPYEDDLQVGQFLDRVFFAINRNSAIADAVIQPFTMLKHGC
ncbi:MAG TPA: hypothetical protein VFB79_23065, partial [Candidatus Angelobacter sp.]|nr:hypothetical protein [Candidatus Angelobacter sp.]